MSQASESTTAPTPAWTSAAACLAGELQRVAVKIRAALAEMTAAIRAGVAVGPANETEVELFRLERGDAGLHLPDDERARLAGREHELAQRNRAAREVTGVELPLYRLAERAGLDVLALDLFLLAVAPEVDDGYGRVLAQLRGGGTPHVDVATAARVLTPEDRGADRVRRGLAPGRPLADLALIELHAPGGARAAGSTLATVLSVPPPVVAYLLGHEVLDARLRTFVAVGQAPPADHRARVTPDLWARTRALLDDREAMLVLEGPDGVGKRELLRAHCAEAGRDLVEVDVARAPGGFSAEEAIAVARLAWLRDAVVLLLVPPLPDDPTRDARPWHRGAVELLTRFDGTVAMARTESDTTAAHFASSRRVSLVPMPLPDVETRAALWRVHLGAAVDNIDFGHLAQAYPITGGVIRRITLEARVRTTARASASAAITHADVVEAVEAEFAPVLETVGRRLHSRASFQDLVLPAETREALLEMEATLRLRHQVLDEWRFGRLLRGRGVSALFYGEPGTGKTLAAGVVARAAGLPLYAIDTASVVSKWVGETEKNLAKVFRAAEAGHAILLFDEADAIFGKRTDVQNSNDRYANMQTNFLLTQIELFNGVTILTTNRESVMDAAFQRRISFRVYFPVPEAVEREDLWRRMLDGHQGPLGAIDFKQLVARLEMSGGYIRNAVVRAAYLSAATGKPLSTELLMHAAELVLRDAGRVI